MPSPTPLEKKPNPTLNWTRWVWGIYLTLLVFGLGVLFLTAAGGLGEMPSFEDLENPKSNLATEIIASDGQVIGKFYLQNRSYTKFHEISPHVIHALLATEDVRFYKHSGIDLRALVRAVVFMGREGGASTITQQLAKALLEQGSKNKAWRVIEKLKEWIIAIKLERNFSKQEIITLYLNTVPFGNNLYGIRNTS